MSLNKIKISGLEAILKRLELLILLSGLKKESLEEENVKQLKKDIWSLIGENYDIDFKCSKDDFVGLLGDQQKWQNIVQLASDIKSDAQWRNVYVLDEIDEPAVDALIEVLRTHPDADIRKRAIFLLGKIGDERAVKPLLEVLEENPDEASKAINEIGMKAFLKVLPEIDMKNRKWYFCINKRAYI
jgi:HEAT repeat protein